ncbi:MAG: LAGLIDADG family homing endonuclease [bacterium]|nr:LAGLIDADG family homing endonuclease [bacterium]
MDKQHRVITNEYIRGLTDGEGTFTFHRGFKLKSGEKPKIPAFVISMHERDIELLKKVKNHLGLKSNINTFGPYNYDNYQRGKKAIFAVRDFGSIKNKIVPLFYKKLIGYKAVQFENWVLNFEVDPLVSKKYGLISRLYKAGYWDHKVNYIHKELFE